MAGPFVAAGSTLHHTSTGTPFTDVTAAAAGTWLKINNLKSFSISITPGEADTANLDSTFKTALPTVPEASASFTTQVVGVDVSYQALKNKTITPGLKNFKAT